MTATLCQMFLGGALLAFAVWLKLHDVRHVLWMCTARSPMKDWIEIPTPIILGLLAVALIVDPLIPGVAGLTVRAATVRASYLGLPEHLRVRVAPLGLQGLAGGDRTCDAPLGDDGSVQIVANLALLETHVVLQLYDETAPAVILRSVTVYISPFVRRQLIGKTITLSTQEKKHAE
jgi:hypothetical protein